MGVLSAVEMFKGTSVSQEYGSIAVLKRTFLVEVDDYLSPAGSVDVNDIAAAANIYFLDKHPVATESSCVDIQIQLEGDSPFFYRVEYTYKLAQDATDNPLDKPDQWSFSGSTVSVPCFTCYENGDYVNQKIIINTAFDPIGGLTKEEGEWTVNVSGNRLVYPYVTAQQYVGAVNSDVFWGGAVRTWRCQSITASRKVEQAKDGTTYRYWEVATQLAYRATKWDLITWNVGLNELVNGARVSIKDRDFQPVSEPAALNLNGTARVPGLAPDARSYEIYRALPFVGVFPAELPPTYVLPSRAS